MERENRACRHPATVFAGAALVALALLACKRKKCPPPARPATPLTAGVAGTTPVPPGAAPTAAASAGTEHASFGALAWSDSNKSWYVSVKYPTRAAARSAAIAGCYAADCVVKAVYHYGQCIAIATGSHRATGWSWQSSGSTARAHALVECAKRGANCRIQTTFCNAGGDPRGVRASPTSVQAQAQTGSSRSTSRSPRSTTR